MYMAMKLRVDGLSCFMSSNIEDIRFSRVFPRQSRDGYYRTDLKYEREKKNSK
jgi:hypothetical protein